MSNSDLKISFVGDKAENPKRDGLIFRILITLLKRVADVRGTPSGKIYIECRVKNRENRWFTRYRKAEKTALQRLKQRA